MTGKTVTTVAELDGLPEGSVVLGFDVDDRRPVVALKPRASDYPHAVPGYWEAMNSELGTTAEDLIANCRTLIEIGSRRNGITPADMKVYRLETELRKRDLEIEYLKAKVRSREVALEAFMRKEVDMATVPQAHEYGESFTGMSCGRVVMKGGGADECGLPYAHPVHGPRAKEVG